MPAKNFPATPLFRDSLKEYAWAHKLSMSAAVAEVVTDFAQERFDPIPPAKADELITIKYTAPPEYEAALARARREGVSLTEVIRHRLTERMVGGPV